MTWVKAILSFLIEFPKIFHILRGWWGDWKAKRAQVKIDKAINKAKKEKNTKDLQKELGKLIK